MRRNFPGPFHLPGAGAVAMSFEAEKVRNVGERIDPRESPSAKKVFSCPSSWASPSVSIQNAKGPAVDGAFLVNKTIGISSRDGFPALFKDPTRRLWTRFFRPGAQRIFQVPSPSGNVVFLMGAGWSAVSRCQLLFCLRSADRDLVVLTVRTLVPAFESHFRRPARRRAGSP